jgi:hypothetical protein
MGVMLRIEGRNDSGRPAKLCTNLLPCFATDYRSSRSSQDLVDGDVAPTVAAGLAGKPLLVPSGADVGLQARANRPMMIVMMMKGQAAQAGPICFLETTGSGTGGIDAYWE